MRTRRFAFIACIGLLAGHSTGQEGPGKTEEPAAAPDRLDDLVESREPTLIGSGFRFTEGPLWDSKRGVLLFSDIPADTIYGASSPAPVEEDEKPPVFTPETAVVFLRPSGNANGLAFDAEGNVVTARHNGTVARVAAGEAKVIASEFEGKRLNSPNDLVVRSDGSIYFTDPTFGVRREERALEFTGVYRIAPDGSLSLVTRQFSLPNGIAFSPDEKRLYVNEHAKREIWAFDVAEDGTLQNGKVLIAMAGARGAADGLKVDTKGNIWTTGPGGVWVVSPEGERLGVIEVARASNVAFGGTDGRTLFVTAGPNIYSIRTKTAGR